jgi:hypothetical protein
MTSNQEFGKVVNIKRPCIIDAKFNLNCLPKIDVSQEGNIVN